MLDITLIREQPELVRKALRDRQMDASPVDAILALDERRRGMLTEVEALKAERNTVSREIGQMKDAASRRSKIEAMSLVADKIARIRQAESAESTRSSGIWRRASPISRTNAHRTARMIARTWSFGQSEQSPNLTSSPNRTGTWARRSASLTLSAASRSRVRAFMCSAAPGSAFQRALIAYMLDLHIRQGYTEQYPPFMVKADTLFASGQLPKFAENLYHDVEDDLWMVPTAEVPLTGLLMDEVVDEAKLPLHYTAYTACFRREKMSARRMYAASSAATSSTRSKCTSSASRKNRMPCSRRCSLMPRPSVRVLD